MELVAGQAVLFGRWAQLDCLNLILEQVAYIVIAREAYAAYGDPRILSDNYDGMKALMTHFIANVEPDTKLMQRPCYVCTTIRF